SPGICRRDRSTLDSLECILLICFVEIFRKNVGRRIDITVFSDEVEDQNPRSQSIRDDRSIFRAQSELLLGFSCQTKIPDDDHITGAAFSRYIREGNSKSMFKAVERPIHRIRSMSACVNKICPIQIEHSHIAV